MKTRLIFILFLSLISFDVSAALKVTLDRNNIRQNETFTLFIEAENIKTLSANQQLSFLPKEFKVLDSRSFNNRNVSQGQYVQQFGWKLNLIASEAGTYSIPSFTIGTESSNPITIRVLPPLDDLEQLNSSSQVKLSARVSSEKVYVQQQIIYTLRVYSAVNTRRKSITPLVVNNAQVEKIGNATEFQTISNGVQYAVLEQKYAIFPQKSGELTIEPIIFRTHIFNTNANFGSASRYRPIELKSKPFTIEVAPQPTSAKSPWIPARKIEIETQWQHKTSKLEVGTPASLDIVIKGVGLLPEQLPELVFPEVSGVKIYRDKPALQTRVNRFGVNSYHFETLSIIPSVSGKIEIPEIKIPFWNTKTDKQDYATFNTLVLDVAPAKKTSTKMASTNPERPKAVVPTLPNQDTLNQTGSNPFWKYLAFIFAGLWLTTLIVLWLKRKKPNALLGKKNTDSSVVPHNAQANRKNNFSDIEEAYKNRNLTSLKSSVIHWANAQTKTSITHTEQLLNFVHSESDKKIIQNELNLLNNTLYSKNSDEGNNASTESAYWASSKLLEALKKLDFQAKKNQYHALPPFYPE